MTYLSQLPQDIRDLAVRLPYRVGLYISESDTTGGDESAEAEQKALENIVTFYVEDTVKSEFAHEVMNAALALKADWASWGEGVHTMPEECHKVFDAMTGVIDIKEVFALKQNLIEIAIVVAQAYCEFSDNAGTVQKLQVYLSLLIRRVRAIFTGGEMQSNDALLNISAAERSAIRLLADTLGVPVSI